MRYHLVFGIALVGFVGVGLAAVAEARCLKCSEYLSCRSAYSAMLSGCGRLDRDRDGIPCESICSRSAVNQLERSNSNTERSLKQSPARLKPKRQTTTADPVLLRARTDPSFQEFVVRCQRGLKELGYYDGALDGLPGRGTRRAVTAFYNAYGLERDALIDSFLLETLELAVDHPL